MRGVEWHVLRELLALRARFNEFFERALLPSSSTGAISSGTGHEPPADVWEADGRLVVEVELPGVESTDLDVRLEEDALVIECRSDATPAPTGSYLRIERPRTRSRRRLPLPVEVCGSPSASLDSGVLTVTMDVAARARRIPVLHEGLSR